jgi:hypothetical protein
MQSSYLSNNIINNLFIWFYLMSFMWTYVLWVLDWHKWKAVNIEKLSRALIRCPVSLSLSLLYGFWGIAQMEMPFCTRQTRAIYVPYKKHRKLSELRLGALPYRRQNTSRSAVRGEAQKLHFWGLFQWNISLLLRNSTHLVCPLQQIYFNIFC